MVVMTGVFFFLRSDARVIIILYENSVFYRRNIESIRFNNIAATENPRENINRIKKNVYNTVHYYYGYQSFCCFRNNTFLLTEDRLLHTYRYDFE